jgi:hypothetical protein
MFEQVLYSFVDYRPRFAGCSFLQRHQAENQEANSLFGLHTHQTIITGSKFMDVMMMMMMMGRSAC